MTSYSAQIEKHLEHSAEQYRDLLQHSEELLSLLGGGDFSRVQEHAARLQQLQLEACQHDELLLPRIQGDLSVWEEHKLYRLRSGFIQSILELNKLLLPKIRAMMAVTSAELEQMRDGRTALAGYASPAVDRRGLRGVG